MVLIILDFLIVSRMMILIKDKVIELQRFPPLSPTNFSSFIFDDVKGNNWEVQYTSGKS